MCVYRSFLVLDVHSVRKQGNMYTGFTPRAGHASVWLSAPNLLYLTGGSEYEFTYTHEYTPRRVCHGCICLTYNRVSAYLQTTQSCNLTEAKYGVYNVISEAGASLPVAVAGLAGVAVGASRAVLFGGDADPQSVSSKCEINARTKTKHTYTHRHSL